jgi:hypothetical protein
MRFRAFQAGVLALAVVLSCLVAAIGAQAPTLVPGARVLLDAHNAYPYEGRHADRIQRAMSTGLPVAIEQDLIWRAGADGTGVPVVGHDLDKVAAAPTLESYFFGTLAPVMEQALKANRRDRWPLVVLNLDFKTNEPEHHAAVLRILERHPTWLTTGQRTATPDVPGPLKLGPLLVLTGSNPDQQTSFHDRLAVGDTLSLFGAYEAPPQAGATSEARSLALATTPVDALLPRAATNYRRWANFPWHVIEKGGQPHAGPWDAADRARLDALVARAHAQGLWIRFYTLNGHPARDADSNGWSKGYNFGSLANAQARWRAVRAAGVDFVATDQYEEFHRAVNPGR